MGNSDDAQWVLEHRRSPLRRTWQRKSQESVAKGRLQPAYFVSSVSNPTLAYVGREEIAIGESAGA